jgi:iron(III) transport system permease protein
LIGVVLLVVLGYLTVGPLAATLSDAFHVHLGDVGVGGYPGDLTSAHLRLVFASPGSGALFYLPLAHTAEVAVATTLLALVVGTGAAWLAARTDVPGRGGWLTALSLPFMIPSWAFAQAWLTVFKNARAAGSPGMLQELGVSTPDWLAYGGLPTVVTLALHHFPMVMLLVAGALRRVDAAQEESVLLLGGSRWSVLRHVLLPGMRPVVVSGGLLVFAQVLGDFGAPYVLGLPARYDVLATSLYGALRNDRAGQAAVLAGVIVVLGAAAVGADALLTRRRRRFETDPGRARPERARLTRAGRLFGAGWLSALVAAAVGFPLAVLALSTVSTAPGRLGGADLTLRYWLAPHLKLPSFPQGVLRSGVFWGGLGHSLGFAAASACGAALVGLLAGYLIQRSTGPVGWLLRQLTFLPYLVPGVALAAGMLSLFAVDRGPLPALYGTFALLVIASVVAHLPYAARTGISALSQLGTQVEEGARSSGAGWFAGVRTIVVPLLRPAAGTALLMPFVSALKELGLVVMLATTTVNLLPALSLELQSYGYLQMANAVTLVITLLAIGIGFILRRLLNRGPAELM